VDKCGDKYVFCGKLLNLFNYVYWRILLHNRPKRENSNTF